MSEARDEAATRATREVRPIAATRMRAVLLALGALYTAQGIPFGFATEYLPVVLRQNGLSLAAIAGLFWLQLPWQLKVLWAKVADHPKVRPRSRGVLLCLQLGLTATVAAFALRPFHVAPHWWFALTFLAAAFAATQDVFVDAFAVRVLDERARGFGNTAQVAGYRLGMMIGGGSLLLLSGVLGERNTFLACAGFVALTSAGAFFRADEAAPAPTRASRETNAAGTWALVKRMFAPETRVVVVLALTFKLGLHMASSLLKPMVVDYGWTRERIGTAIVTVGAVATFAGAAAGGALHRVLRERRALACALVVQALVCAPLVLVNLLHAPPVLTTGVIALEHFGSGLGTTVLFAALMTATRPTDAGLHYTVLTSANAVAIGVGGLVGGVCADHAGKSFTFALATLVCLLPGALLFRWNEAARASRG